MRVRGEALNAQRAEVYRTMFAVYRTKVQHHVECLIEDREEAADLVAEVFALAWMKLDARRPPGLIWLLRVAENKLRDRERSLRARDRAMDTIRRLSAPHGSHDLLDTIAVHLAIDTVLTSRERRAVKLFYWDRLAAGEIAEVLKCSQASVFTTLSRARAKLEIELTSQGSG